MTARENSEEEEKGRTEKEWIYVIFFEGKNNLCGRISSSNNSCLLTVLEIKLVGADLYTSTTLQELIFLYSNEKCCSISSCSVNYQVNIGTNESQRTCVDNEVQGHASNELVWTNIVKTGKRE